MKVEIEERCEPSVSRWLVGRAALCAACCAWGVSASLGCGDLAPWLPGDVPQTSPPSEGTQPAPPEPPSDGGESTPPGDGQAPDSGGDGGGGPPGAGAGCQDRHEPNDTEPDATPLLPGELFEGSLCDGSDVDFVRLIAPASGGSRFEVSVRFQHSDGDLDVDLIDADTGLGVDGSYSVTDDEVVGAVSDGGDYFLYLRSFGVGGAGQAYTVEVSALERSTQSCCASSAEPGCEDASVQACVCALDDTCCTDAYDEQCSRLAQTSCQLICEPPPPESDCCTVSDVPGCQQPEVNECVCGLVPFCCNASFDATCVDLAAGLCGASCTDWSIP